MSPSIFLTNFFFILTFYFIIDVVIYIYQISEMDFIFFSSIGKDASIG